MYCIEFLVLSFHGNSLLMFIPTHFNLEEGGRKLVQNVYTQLTTTQCKNSHTKININSQFFKMLMHHTTHASLEHSSQICIT